MYFDLTGAKKKVDKSSREAKWQPKLKIICDAMEETAIQTETTIRELWENLIANELMDSSVHPEIVNILKRMDASDAFLLRRIANQDKSAEGRHALEGKLQRAEREIAGLQVRRWGGKGKPPTMKGIDKQLGDALKEKEELTGALGNLDQLREQGDDFSYEHLINLGLVNKENDLYRLTQIGNAFVRVVTEPQ